MVAVLHRLDGQGAALGHELLGVGAGLGRLGRELAGLAVQRVGLLEGFGDLGVERLAVLPACLSFIPAGGGTGGELLGLCVTGQCENLLSSSNSLLGGVSGVLRPSGVLRGLRGGLAGVAGMGSGLICSIRGVAGVLRCGVGVVPCGVGCGG
ncbi:hypothetical protein ABZ508_26250 [Streptomyces lavendulocolor]|uniref:Uncharacterized protein n=1 Tax=Streptomyces lavendulocolor TaxID=67316 RepID=A0ABV2WC21_9ACTN